ncbi:Zn-dependent exopeptidase [Polychaeton citri CBS 116435]|uniref:Zn-dependent exopeptidase n=1 Tax=Polychaeton citri CBS 116435 TaxID=1314669 RepID=A0A9P4UUH0_9PEZI|nr:Zn-dependent exopeptidase [Polychaeton citri CBS 116435]
MCVENVGGQAEWIYKGTGMVALEYCIKDLSSNPIKNAFFYNGGDPCGSCILPSGINCLSAARLPLSVDEQTLSQAQWTADKWSEAGIASSLTTHHVYLNYPVNNLEEDVLLEDVTTSYPNRIPTFHGYSSSGSVSAEYAYVGRGQQVDFDRLVELGVELEGKIAMSRYRGPFRGLNVKNAQEHGMIGVILFTDPGDDGNVTEANGYAAYPNGPARQSSSVQRGSVLFLSTYLGDSTTLGYSSKENSSKADRFMVVPKIPSIPISYLEAIPILATLDGHRIPGSDVNRTNWVGSLEMSYSTGSAPGVTLDMSNYMEDTYTDIWDAIGIINGTNADETIVIGNHRDAWIIGGASDPNTGTAIIVELGRAMGRLLSQGWQPKRNIVLCSWDGEEYGLLGSTEWVEEHIPWLTETAVSYLNIDIAVAGPHPGISATPELHRIAIDTTKKIMWPALGENETMHDVWLADTEGEVGVLGSGSDYTAFVHKVFGAIDMGSENELNQDPVYHYHSNYDSYHWMAAIGDPEFLVHKAMGQYMALLGYHLASDDYIPFDLPSYADQMDLYYEMLQVNVSSAGSGSLDTSALRTALDTFRSKTSQVVQLEQQARSLNDSALLKVVNSKYRDFQRGFTSQGGLPGREFYKHVIFAPGVDTGYTPVTFPGITEALGLGI